MADYRFVQGLDYGTRSGTRGLSFHMAEGGDGTLGFLARRGSETRAQWINRVNGVSCHALLLTTGEVVQMVDFDNACGNLNPDDRAEEYGYYGHHHLRDVLGAGWPNPNEWTLSMEICGWRGGGAPVPSGVTPGPNAKQVAAAIAWAQDMKNRYPELRGATGHHDQSPKACPGLTANMKAIFAGVGGHGLWTAEVPNVPGLQIVDEVAAPGVVEVKAIAGVLVIQTADLEPFGAPPGTPFHVVSKGRLLGNPLGVDTPGNDRHTVRILGGPGVEQAVILDGQVVFTPDPLPPADCTAPVAAAKKATADAAAAIATTAAAEIKQLGG